MSVNESKLISHAATVFAVGDVRKSADFYRDQLGFTITFEWGDPLMYAVANRDESVFVHFTKKQNDSVPSDEHPAIYIFVHDVDSIYREFEAKDVEIANQSAIESTG